MIKLTKDKPYNGPGIYMIQSSINDKVYIGQSVRISDRVFKSHVKELLAGKHVNRHLQNHVNKHLPDYKCIEDFLEFSVVWRCSKSSLTEMEQEWIDKFPKEQRFNICDKAEVPIRHNQQPEWRRKEIKKNMQNAGKLSRGTPEARREMSKRMQLAWKNPESRAKYMEAWADPEVKANHKRAQASHTYKAKMTILLKTRWADPEYQKRVSDSQKQRFNDPEIRIRASKITTQLWNDPEFREKQTIARKASWAKRKAKQLEDNKIKRTKFNNQKALEV